MWVLSSYADNGPNLAREIHGFPLARQWKTKVELFYTHT